MNTLTSFDGIRIAYHDEGAGPAVILLHGFGVDGLGQFGDFERILPILEKRQEMFREMFGAEMKRHFFYLKPGDKRRVKQALARKRARKKIRKESD